MIRFSILGKRLFSLLGVLLTVAFVLIVLFLGVETIRDHAAKKEQDITAETADPSDKTYLGADYDRRIFGNYRLRRGSSDRQDIYMDALNESGDTAFVEKTLVGGGTIEKLMHDGERYIAYHFSEQIIQDTDREDVRTVETGEQYYAVLDTQTEQIERFEDIEALSEAIRDRQIHFGNWFYTYAQDSSEGIRTPLVGEYAFEYLDSAHCQNILRREVPVFYGVLENVQTDGRRYFAFRQRIIRDDAKPWYNDPVTNTLLSAPSEKWVGLYRRQFLIWYAVYYDQYVLFDAESNTVREFEKERELNAVCKSESILLRPVEIRKN